MAWDTGLAETIASVHLYVKVRASDAQVSGKAEQMSSMGWAPCWALV